MKFIYIMNDDGTQRRGKVDAETKEEALKTLGAMGVNVVQIGTSSDDMTNVGPDTEVETKEVIRIESEESPPEDPVDSMPDEVVHDIGGWPPKPPVTPTFGSETPPGFIAVESMPDDPEPQKTVKETRDFFRQHVLLYGTYEIISGQVKTLLATKFGIIHHLCMQPDMKGNIMLAVAIEYDVPVEEAR